MHVHLTHPKHGTKFASHEVELKQDLSNGWVRYSTFPEPEELPPVDPIDRNTLHLKRGRPRKELA